MAIVSDHIIQGEWLVTVGLIPLHELLPTAWHHGAWVVVLHVRQVVQLRVVVLLPIELVREVLFLFDVETEGWHKTGQAARKNVVAEKVHGSIEHRNTKLPVPEDGSCDVARFAHLHLVQFVALTDDFWPESTNAEDLTEDLEIINIFEFPSKLPTMTPSYRLAQWA